MQETAKMTEFRRIDFSKLSSVKIGGVFDVQILHANSDFNGIVIGGANNILISPNPPKLGILSDEFNFIRLNGDLLTIGAACKSAKIYNFAKRENIAGFEFLRNIPGTLGGLITMNAGLAGFEISNNLINVKTKFGIFDKKDLNFSYRKSEIQGVILEAAFKISRGFDAALSDEIFAKRKNQPKHATFGSVFKNPKGDFAGRLIEAAGLKGFQIGAAKFSEIHANFLINAGGATFTDAIDLINLAKKKVFEKFGVKLECEVKIL